MRRNAHKQADIKRAVKAFLAFGIDPEIIIEIDGTIRIIPKTHMYKESHRDKKMNGFNSDDLKSLI